MDESEEKQNESSQNTDNTNKNAKRNDYIFLIYLIALTGLFIYLSFLQKYTLAFFVLLLSIIPITKVYINIIIKRKTKKLKYLHVGLLTLSFISVLFTLFLSYLRIDAAPIPNDYIFDDIRSAAPEYNNTFKLLNSLADQNSHLDKLENAALSGDPNAIAELEKKYGKNYLRILKFKNVKKIEPPAIGLSEEDVNNVGEMSVLFRGDDFQIVSQRLLNNEELILSTWQKAKKGRDIIAELDTYDEIADLTEPKYESEFPWVRNFGRLFVLYRAYICLQSIKGNHEIAIDELLLLNSVYKKMSLNARSLLMKSICIAKLEANIIPANFIINNPETPREILLLIEQHIVPISEEYTSLRNSILFEYLTFKYTIKCILLDPRVKHTLPSVLKFNSSSRLLINLSNKWIAENENKDEIKEYKVWPAIYPNLPVKLNQEGKLPLYYNIYNIAGGERIQGIAYEIEGVTSAKTRAEVRSDLLQIVLNKRLGKEVNLKARAYGNEYIIDNENKEIFSPGPDEKPYTEDDIILPINPEVLNLTE